MFACVSVFAQTAATPEVQGLPPRAAPRDYQAQGKAGKVNIGADFVAHAVPTMESPLMSEDYVAVEIAFYGGTDGKTVLSFEDFSLRINGKKSPIPAQQYGMVMKSLSDPEWIPDVPAEGPKSKTGLSGSAGGAGLGGGGSDPKVPPKMPFPLRRAMEQKAQKSALPEGERTLPIAGLIFFPYRGKDDGIHTVELIYNGKEGKATIGLRQ